MLAEERVVKAIAAVAKPAQRTTYRDLARARHKLKENYVEFRENNEADAIENFLSAIGHNLVDRIYHGRKSQ